MIFLKPGLLTIRCLVSQTLTRAKTVQTKARPTPGPSRDEDSRALNRISSMVISGLLAVGAVSYYYSKGKQERRLKDCEYLPVDENYKTTNVK